MSNSIKESVASRYEYENGVFTHRKSGTHGSSGKEGRLYICAMGKRYSVGQLVYLFELGFIPETNRKTVLDHIDGDVTNNKLSNLRLSTPRENARNNKRKREAKLPNGVYIQYITDNKTKVKIWDGSKFTHQRTFIATLSEIKSFLRSHFLQIEEAKDKFNYITTHFEPELNFEYYLTPLPSNQFGVVARKNSHHPFKEILVFKNRHYQDVKKYLEESSLPKLSHLKKLAK